MGEKFPLGQGKVVESHSGETPWTSHVLGCRESSVHIDHLLHSKEVDLQHTNSSDYTKHHRDFNEPFTSQGSTLPQWNCDSTPWLTPTPRTTAGTSSRTTASSESPTRPPQSPVTPSTPQQSPVKPSTPVMRHYPDRVRVKPCKYND